MEKKPLIVLTGPTAVGKTALSLKLAKAIGGEIISADSMQIYRHMDIGSAKIMPEEMDGVSHYLIDELEPWEKFHVVRFQEMAKQAMDNIWQRGHIPIVVGGTGFYIQALLYDIHFIENPSDPSFRENLENLAEEKGDAWLHQQLAQVDPKSAREIHMHNRKRVIRALEYYHQTGETISEHNEREQRRVSPYNALYFVLTDDRSKLYRRIEQRVDQMMQQGLMEEVKALKEAGCTRDMTSMQGLGYRELLAWMDGEHASLEAAVMDIKKNTRHFAKRQLTWFRRERNVIWLDKSLYQDDESAILKDILCRCDEAHMIKETEDTQKGIHGKWN